MTVTATSDYSGPFAPDGVTTSFPFNFVALSADEVVVLRMAATEAQTILSGYTVTLTDTGGTVNFGLAPAAGDPIYIVSNPSFEQQATFANQGNFSAKAIGKALDRAALRDIALASALSRAALAPPTETLGVLPPAAERAGRFFVFDADGLAGAASGLGADAALRTDLAAVSGFTLIKYKSSRTGTFARSASELARVGGSQDNNVFHWIDPLLDDAIQTSSNATDLTVYIQAAIESGLGRIQVPRGSFLATGLTVPLDVEIENFSSQTIWVPNDNTSTMFSFAGRNRFVGGQVIPATQRTGGLIFGFAGGDCRVERVVSIQKCFKIADISGSVSNVVLDDFNLQNNNNNGASELILVNTLGAGCRLNGILSDNNPATQPLATVRVRACADLLLGYLNLIHGGTPLLIDPPSGSIVASIDGNELFLDTSSNSGMVLDTSGGGAIVRCGFDRIEANSHGSHGVQFIRGSAPGATLAGVEIDHLETHVCGGDGAHFVGASMGNVTIKHHTAAGNANGAGLFVGAGCSGPTVDEAQYGANDGINTANKYGISGGAGSTAKISGGKITGNTTANITGDVSGWTIQGVSGIVTKNSGNGTLASGGTSVVINHGLAAAPSASTVKIWATANQGSTPLYIDTTTITSTQFTVKTVSAAAANITFGWEASCLGA